MTGTGAPPDQAGDFFVLAEALRAFKAGPLSDRPSDRILAKAAGVSPTTIGDWLRGTRFPQDIGKVLAVVRMLRAAATDRGIVMPAGLLEDDKWRAAHQLEARRRAGVVSDEVKRVQGISVLVARLATRVRMGEANPRRLGVHAAITVPGASDEGQPEYVLRDADVAEHGVRAKVEAAARHGGFVLLVGGSSVGKTRSALEAIKAVLPDWWLVHPTGPAQVAEFARVLPAQTVIWLDELQRYLDGEDGLTGAMGRCLCRCRPRNRHR